MNFKIIYIFTYDFVYNYNFVICYILYIVYVILEDFPPKIGKKSKILIITNAI